MERTIAQKLASLGEIVGADACKYHKVRCHFENFEKMADNGNVLARRFLKEFDNVLRVIENCS